MRRWVAMVLAIAGVVGVTAITAPVASASWPTPATTWEDVVTGGKGIDIDPVTGDVWVSDEQLNGLRKFDSDGNQLLTLGGFGTTAGLFNSPGDVAVGLDGDVFVTDVGNNRVQHFAADGTWLGMWGNSSLFSNPLGIAADAAGNVYVADVYKNAVRKFSPAGALLQSYPVLSTSPFGIEVDPSGRIWVTSNLGTVTVADSTTGDLVMTLSPGGQLIDVDFDLAGNAHVFEFNSRVVIAYDPAGNQIDGTYTSPQSLRLKVGPDGRLFVVGGNDVLVFGTPAPEDSDGVPAAIENGAPNGGDGNLDGTPDAEQDQVASLPSADGSGYLTVVSPSGTTLANVATNWSTDDPYPPVHYAFRTGLLSFAVNGVDVGGTIEVDVTLPDTATPEIVSKVVGGVHRPFTAYTLDGSTYTLTLTDGDELDGDGSANGTIVDPIGFADRLPAPTEVAITSSSSTSTIGESVTFTATVTAREGITDTPTGEIRFDDAGVEVYRVAAVGGVAQWQTAFTSLGDHLISATYLPDTNWFDPSYWSIWQSVTPGPLASMTITPAAVVVGPNVPVAFTVSGADALGTPLGDLTTQATFAISPTGACTANSCLASTNGVRTVTATIGSITATAMLEVRTSQTITFNNITTKTMLQSPLTIAPRSNRGLAVAVTSITPDVCTVSGFVVTFVGAGSCTLTAEQPGTATIAPATPVVRTFTINRATQTITFAAQTAKATTATPVQMTATASSGLPVTFTSLTPAVCSAGGADGGTIDLLDAGRCSIRAEQSGNAVYGTANPVTRNFNVTKLANAITFTSPGTRTMAQSPLTVSATASSGLPVTFTTTTPWVCTADGADGSTIVLVAAGSCTVRADQPGDFVYRAANGVSRTFTVNGVAQTITFASPGTKNLAESPVPLAATASSGLPVTFSTTTPAVCVTNGTDLLLIAVGTCTIRADQGGDAYWRPANGVTRNINVTAAPPAVQSFGAGATVMPSTGGSVTLTGAITSASTCRFSVTPALAGLPVTVPCPGAEITRTIALPANASAASITYSFVLAAQRPGAPTATSSPVTVRVAPAGEQLADLHTTATAAPNSAAPGADLTYTVVVTNEGPQDASAGVVTATVPGNATFASGTGPQGSCTVSAGTISCALGTLASSASTSVTIHLTASGAGVVYLNGSATSSSTDLDNSDDTFQAGVAIVEPPIVYADDWTSQIYTLSPYGSSTAITTAAGYKTEPVVSPDHRLVAYARLNPATSNFEVWVVGIDGTDEHLVGEPLNSNVSRPSWSPDSTMLVFNVARSGMWKAMVATAVGPPDAHLLIPDTSTGERHPVFTHDGASIIFQDSCVRTGPPQCRYHRINADGTGEATPYLDYPVGNGLVVDPADEWFYFTANSGPLYRARVDGTAFETVASNVFGSSYWSLSPDGGRIAYTELVNGKNVISTVNVDGTGHRQLTLGYSAPDPAGCYSPSWSRDGSTVVMHCYPGGGAISIYQVSSTVPAPVTPQGLGGSFRSKSPEWYGIRPTW